MPTVNRISVHPIKSLNPIDIDIADIARGGLEYDRKYAMFDSNDEYVSGKINDNVYGLRMDFDIESEEVSLRAKGDDETHVFDMDAERSDLEAWLSEYFGEEISIVEATDTRFTGVAGGTVPLEISAPGPSVVSTETYREIASWFDDLETDDIRKRFRSNIEIDGVPAFWEDKLFSDKEHVVKFRIGDVAVTGVLPLSRCNVPTKDPRTGEQNKEFMETFIKNREEKFPEWADAEHLGQHLPTRSQHYFYLTVVTRIPTSENGKAIHLGDEVEILGEEALVKSL